MPDKKDSVQEPEKNGSSQESERNRPFIREKVVKPPRTKRQTILRMLACVFLAAVAGIAAGTSFAVVRPMAENYFNPTTAAPTIPVTIPTDAEQFPEPSSSFATRPSSGFYGTDEGTEPDTEETTGTGTESGPASETGTGEGQPSETGTGTGEGQPSETGTGTGEGQPSETGTGTGEGQPSGTGTGAEEVPETAAGDGGSSETGDEPSQETETEPETEPVTRSLDEILESAFEEHEYTVDDMTAMYSSLRKTVQFVDSGIVTVHSVRQETDWFDNPIEMAGLYAGAVIAATEQEFLILAPMEAVARADSLKVTFADGTEAAGTVRQVDDIVGMAVICVNQDEMEESARQKIMPIPLGNSFILRQGDIIIAVGAPSGAVHSSAYGEVSYVLRNVQVPDGIMRLIYADVAHDPEAGTFLVNTSGQLVGWVTDDYESSGGMAIVRGVSDYKATLEKMSNGIAIPYLGIQGQEVTDAMQEAGMPAGVYVSECILGGPAYDSGIQNGDIITRIGENGITGMSEYQARLNMLNKGDQVTIAVQRKGADEYIELEYQVIVGAR